MNNNHEIKLEFNYTEAEYLSAARLLTLRDSKTVFRLILTSVYLVGSVSILTGLLTDYPWWAGSIVTALLLTALFYNGLVRVPRKYFRGDPKFRDHYQLTFSDEGIGVKTAQLDSKLSWSLYSKVIEGSDQYLLVYGKGVRMMTVVPKRVFRDTLQENAFRELVTLHITSSSTPPKLRAKEEPAEEYKPTSLNPPDWR
jgi:hypothetical protein